MLLMSWNVNGLRAILKKGFVEFVQRTQPDVLCLQEVRATPEQVQLELPGYEMHWNPAERAGYSGVAVLTKVRPVEARRGMGVAAHDSEGRVLVVEYPDYQLVNVYTPNSQRGLTRLDYRMEWDQAFLAFVRKLQQRKPVVFAGDLNVAHQEIDLANPKSNERNAGFTREERDGMDRLIAAGFVDTFREFTKEGGHYTWWAPFANSRARNIGWRIDYFCISSALRPRLQAAKILPNVMGSDHCPVTIEID
jgi:exodeoxyribonuclease-3